MILLNYEILKVTLIKTNIPNQTVFVIISTALFLMFYDFTIIW